MYLHVGGDAMVRTSEIVGILERDHVVASAATREHLAYMRASNRVEDLSGGHPKTIILCRERVLLSPISAGTLRHRLLQSSNLGRTRP